MYENNNNYNAPGTNPVPPAYYAAPASDPAVDALVDSAFGKGLAATIMCGFPIASIIAIVMGSMGLGLVEQAKTLAAQRGVKPGGKNVAANVLGKIGKIAGIVMTCWWAFYFIFIVFLFSMI